MPSDDWERHRTADEEVRVYINTRVGDAPPLRTPANGKWPARVVAGAVAAIAVIGDLFARQMFSAEPEQVLDASGSVEGDALLSCNGTDLEPFPAAAFERSTQEEAGRSPEASALRRRLTDGDIDAARTSGYRLLNAGPDRAVYAAGEPPRVTVAVVVNDGGWRLSEVSACQVAPYREGSYTVEWQVISVDRAARRLEVEVLDAACSNVPLETRLQDPDVLYTSRSVTVTFYATVPEGDGHCVGTQPLRRSVELREALGGRRLLDGSTYPAGDR